MRISKNYTKITNIFQGKQEEKRVLSSHGQPSSGSARVLQRGSRQMRIQGYYKLQEKSGITDYKGLLEWYTKANLGKGYNAEVKSLLRELAKVIAYEVRKRKTL